MKRSNEPVFWMLFGAGGMLSALIGAALILIVGILAPVGWIVPTRTMDYAHASALVANPLGKFVVFAIVSLILWHSVHRIGETLHDVAHIAAAPLLRGLAMLATLACAWLVLTI